MIFSDREREIYEAPDGRKFDPLRVERRLRVASGGRLNEWLDLIDDYHRILAERPDAREELLPADVAAAQAEDGVVNAARAAFEMDQNKVLDAAVLETLDHFLRWLEGKDSPAARQPTSRPATADSAPPRPATTSSCPST